MTEAIDRALVRATAQAAAEIIQQYTAGLAAIAGCATDDLVSIYTVTSALREHRVIAPGCPLEIVQQFGPGWVALMIKRRA